MVETERNIEQLLDHRKQHEEQNRLNGVIGKGRVSAEAKAAHYCVHPVPDGCIEKEEPQQSVDCKVDQLV